MKNFYIIYDVEHKKVGISLNMYSTAKIEKKSNGWIIAIVIIILLAIAIGIGIYCYKNNRNNGSPEVRKGETILSNQID